MEASCSKASKQRNEIARIPLRSDPHITKVQHQSRPCEDIEFVGLARSFLHSCLKLLKDDKVMLEIQTLIDKYEKSTPIIVA